MVENTTSTDEHDASELYRRKFLSPGTKSIRLLHVHAGSGAEDDDDLIESELLVVDLDTQEIPSYAALSYVCGSEDDVKHLILCDSFQLATTANCHSALSQLRKNLRRDFIIWVDAISINQDDNGEKMSQIRLMGDIFARAEIVYVFLGASTDATNRAIAYFQDFPFTERYVGKEQASALRIWTALWLSYTGAWGLTRFPFPLLSKREMPFGNSNRLSTANIWMFSGPSWLSRVLHWNATYASYSDLNELLNREWVKRMWTYQEILLASNPIVVCGNHHLRWSLLEIGIIFLEFSGLNYRDNRPIIPILETWAKVIMCRDQLDLSHAEI